MYRIRSGCVKQSATNFLPPPTAIPRAGLQVHAPRAPRVRACDIRSRAWVFTVNNPAVEELNTFRPGIFGVMQEERGENGTLHLQGVCYFSQPVTLAAVKKLHGRAHWEIMKGTLERAIKYCTKPNPEFPDAPMPVRPPVSWGEKPAQGKRSDLHDCAIAMAEVEGSVQKKLRMVAETNPSAFIKYHRGFAALAALQVKPTPKGKPAEWHDWQKWLLAHLTTVPNDRTIIWITDAVGGTGKSTLVQHLITSFPEDYTTLSGAVADMAYAYEGERVAFFDVPRTKPTKMDHLYEFAEQLKNGSFLSTKYESRRKIFPSPHVVFFSNSPPEAGKWSEDRLVHVNLSPFTPFTIPVLPFAPPALPVDNLVDEEGDEFSQIMDADTDNEANEEFHFGG